MEKEAEGREALGQVLIANDGEVLARLRLSAAEAARVCNVTPRQLIYWTKKGLVKPSPDGDHDYDVYAMEKVIRIRQALEKGYSLEKAAQIVQRDLGSLQAEVKRLDEAHDAGPRSGATAFRGHRVRARRGHGAGAARRRRRSPRGSARSAGAPRARGAGWRSS